MKTVSLCWGWGNRLNMIMFWHRHPDVHFKWDIADKKEGEMVNTLTSTFEEYIDFSDCNISISLDVQGSLLRQKEESLIPPNEVGSPWHRQKYVRGLMDLSIIDRIKPGPKVLPYLVDIPQGCVGYQVRRRFHDAKIYDIPNYEGTPCFLATDWAEQRAVATHAIQTSEVGTTDILDDHGNAVPFEITMADWFALRDCEKIERLGVPTSFTEGLEVKKAIEHISNE